MKKLSLLFVASLLVFSCSQEGTLDAETPQIDADLSTMLPARDFDTSANGIYAGIITTFDRQFHAKVWINAGNDGNYSAMMRSNNEKVSFSLVDKTEDTFYYAGERGSFTLDVSDINDPLVVDATFDEGHADIVVAKEIGGAKFGIILGTYTETDFLTPRGTWDYIINTAVPGLNFIDQTVIQLPAPFTGVKRERAFFGDFEAGDSCYGNNLPFFISTSMPPAADDVEIELMLTGQQTPYPAQGTTVLYDVAFSKFLCDDNGLDYNRMIGFPTSTTAIFFDPPLDPLAGTCRNITFGGPVGHGMYAEVVDADGSFASFGLILIDTSTFVPVPPATLTTVENTLEGAVAKIKR